MDFGDEAREAIEVRRKIAVERARTDSEIYLDGAWHDLSGSADVAADKPQNGKADKAETAKVDPRKHFVENERLSGLALSGGGIRSATVSLGLVEALASRGRFYGFDFMSTVSGGGYLGSFARALYVRGEVGEQDKDDPVDDTFGLADATLLSLPDQQYFRGKPGHSAFVKDGKTLKNPLWWLRENGRYLAPNGMADYGYALSHIVRNWVTWFAYLLAVLMVAFAVVQLAMVGVISAAERFEFSQAMTKEFFVWLYDTEIYSPLVPLAMLMAVIGSGIAAGYWLSLPKAFAQSTRGSSRWKSNLRVAIGCLFPVALLIGLFALHRNGLLPTDGTAIAWAVSLTIASASALVAAGSIWFSSQKQTRFDFRARMTRLLSGYNIAFLIICAAALFDWIAIEMRIRMKEDELQATATLINTGAISGVLASVFSVLVAKLPEWFGKDGSGWQNALAAHARTAALAASLIVLGALAFLADLLVIKLLWRGKSWILEAKKCDEAARATMECWLNSGELDWAVFVPVMILITLFALLFSSSKNFPNLLSLTPFYSSRLTRAYLGASNPYRLEMTGQSKRDLGDVGDDIGLEDYMKAKCPAPLHFINVTRNRTVGDVISHYKIEVAEDDPFVRENISDPRGRLSIYDSSLAIRDRHGDSMVFGPSGARVGAEFFRWDQFNEAPPSLGMLCGISGSAAGSGMGRLTSLGSSMAMTLANARLGYWMEEPKEGGICPKLMEPQTWLPGLTCLSSELLGRFGTKDFWFLSDGGHSENSGALTLLERGCELILVADNAQDRDYNFSDLEIFIRMARTDIGMEVTVVDPSKFPDSLNRVKPCFFNGRPGDWRKDARDETSNSFALLLEARDIRRRVDGKLTSRYEGRSWIVWLKPKTFAGLPADIVTYAKLHEEFPQQTTADQFFDEAQWESYRRLGFEMGWRLFHDRHTLAEHLPIIYPN